MSKNSMSKSQAKIKKAKADAQKRQAQKQLEAKQEQKRLEAEQAQKKLEIEKAKKRIFSESENLYEHQLPPTKNTVIFKGMTIPIADALASQALSHVSFPLEDFYAEIPIRDGKTLKLHWRPFENEERKKAARTYIMNAKYDQADHRHVRCNDFPLEAMVGEIYHEYDSVPCVSFVVFDKNTFSGNTIGILSSALVDLYNEDRARYDEHIHVSNYIELFSFAIQYLVNAYMTGEEIPSFPELKTSKEPASDSRPSSSTRKSTKPQPKDPQECVAYIRYDVEDGEITISNSSRQYEMSWWIVSGHKRHYKTGKVSDVQPYIKGDKENPDAQRALQEFKDGMQRIKYYHLIARRSK